MAAYCNENVVVRTKCNEPAGGTFWVGEYALAWYHFRLIRFHFHHSEEYALAWFHFRLIRFPFHHLLPYALFQSLNTAAGRFAWSIESWKSGSSQYETPLKARRFTTSLCCIVRFLC